MRITAGILALSGVVFLPYAFVILLFSPLFVGQAIAYGAELKNVIPSALALMNLVVGCYVWVTWVSFSIFGKLVFPIKTSQQNIKAFWAMCLLQSLLWIPIWIMFSENGGSPKLDFSDVTSQFVSGWVLITSFLSIINIIRSNPVS